MKTDKIISILRSPYGFSKAVIKAAQLEACDRIESLEDVYNNMRGFAEANRLNTVTTQKEDQGDEEIIKLDLKKARESGFEYIITYNSTPITGLPDDLKHYKNENYMAIIKKRHIKTDSAKQP